MAIEETLACIVDLLQEKSHLAELVTELKETNRLLAIIAGAPYSRQAVIHTASKPTMLRSVAMDGTVREVHVDDHLA